MSIVTATATDALAKLRDLDDCRFVAIVFDDRGRERSIDEIEAEAAQETQTLPIPHSGESTHV